MELLEIINVNKSFGKKKVLKNVNLTILILIMKELNIVKVIIFYY